MLHRSGSRRDVLVDGLAIAAAGVLGRQVRGVDAVLPCAGKPQSSQPNASLPAVIKTSVAAYSFRNELDTPGKRARMSLMDLVELAARWRVDAVEPTSYYFYSTGDAWLIGLKRKVMLAGLEISGTPVGNNFCQKPGPGLDQAIAHVKEWVDIAVKLGSPAMRVFAGSQSAAPTREEAFETVVKSLKQVAGYAGQRGIFLTLENHGFMTESADSVLRILDAVDSEWLGVNLDTGNFPSDAYAGIAKLAPRAITCQIKPFVHEADKSAEPDFQRIIGILREAKYRGYVALEYEKPGGDPHREVPIYLEKIKDAIRATA